MTYEFESEERFYNSLEGGNNDYKVFLERLWVAGFPDKVGLSARLEEFLRGELEYVVDSVDYKGELVQAEIEVKTIEDLKTYLDANYALHGWLERLEDRD